MKLSTLPSLAFLSLLPGLSQAAVVYDWTPDGDQGLLGWTTILEDDTNNVFPTQTYSLRDIGPQLGSPKGTFDGIDGAQDVAHTTLVVQSPAFTITGDTSISFTLVEGTNTSPLVADFASLPANAGAPGYVGLALMQVSTGDYFLDASKGGNGGSEAFTWTNAQLLTAINGEDPSESYVLQLIDYKDAGWGHVALQTVTIVPEPSSALLFSLGALALFRRRRA